MKIKILTTLALAGALAFGYTVGANVEANTHALQVARITGTPYADVLDAWGRVSITEHPTEADENCDGDCEANQR